MSTSTPAAPRMLTPEELGAFVRVVRGTRVWSQEQLAEISGLSVRTIQRVEQGGSANFDTRRALAVAFGIEDIDALNKPFSIPTEEDLKVAQQNFDRDHVTLSLTPLSSGRQLAVLAEATEMDMSEPAFELERPASAAFAALVDYFREYRDCSELYTATQKLDVYDDLQRLIDELMAAGVSLRYAERSMQTTFGSDAVDAKPVKLTALYLLAFRSGEEPGQIAMPKAARISW